MRRRSSKLTFALVLACCALSPIVSGALASASGRARATSASLLGGVNADGLGLGGTPAAADHTIALAHTLKSKMIRVELPWALLQPRAPGQLDPQALAYTDRLLSDAAAKGIGVIVMVDVTPCWATSAPAQLKSACVPGQRGRANSYPPTQPADFAALVKALAERYGSEMTALEVWNEPDQANEKYFAGPDKAQRYAALLKAAYTAIKQVDPRIDVLGGSLVGTNGVFLRLLYQDGIKGYYDGLAVHFYTLSLASLRAFRAVQVANGDTAPLWLDEFGWSDCYPRHKIQEEQGCVTPAVQAQNIRNIYRALGSIDYVAAATLYKLQDGGGESFGVLTAKGAHKPAFAALSQVLASPIGPLSPVRLSLRKSRSKVIASGSGPVGDFMHLEVFQGSVLRFRAVFTLDRFNRFSLALPTALGTHNLRVRVYQQWTGLSGAAQRTI
jgi:Cellulase (glycosyl hydrolase family 5)